MTHAVVTGGSGKLGRAVLKELVAHGYQVLNIDQVLPPRGDLPPHGPDRPHRFRRGDGSDRRRHRRAARAVRRGGPPRGDPGARPHCQRPGRSGNNVPVEYVFEAARQARYHDPWSLPRARPCSALPFDTPPPYVPVDEEYFPLGRRRLTLAGASCLMRLWPLNSAAGTQSSRWPGLRFSNVMDPEDYAKFPSFDADPQLPQMEPLGLHRCAGRRPGGTACNRGRFSRDLRRSSSPTPIR